MKKPLELHQCFYLLSLRIHEKRLRAKSCDLCQHFALKDFCSECTDKGCWLLATKMMSLAELEVELNELGFQLKEGGKS